ncbi:hypothetical protein QCA50_013235 [Cerrena zonata]|uniref:Glucose-methanol-choline oxidoreductase N-terminal domain-containing protein n=1 Tax=Cerrena zonata TaxID=2478898 RepID=A0AAW0FUQ6_9APHY
MRSLSPTFSLLLSFISFTSAITLPSHYDLPQNQKARILAVTAGTSAITTQASDISGKSFDYVVVGGGTAGLVVAARLAEDATKKVVVLEAGDDHSSDPRVQIPAEVGSTVGDPDFDWLYTTVPQKNSNNKVLPFIRGKVLGGCSAINAMIWDRSSKVEYDNIANLGNPGWDFTDLFPYMKKPENFTPPDPTFAAKWNQTFDASTRGTGGPLSTVFPNFIPDSELPQEPSALELGIPIIKEPMAGQTTGAWKGSASIDFNTRARAFSTSYIDVAQASGRNNLLVLTGAQVTKINWASGKTTRQDNTTSSAKPSTVTASGVSFVVNGTAFTVSASREVILSGSTVGSPQLLELSGVGDKTRLGSLGIKSVVDLPGVGENLQEHFFVVQSFVVKNGTQTLDPLLTNQTFFNQQAALWQQRPATGSLGYVSTAITMVNLQRFIPDWKNLLISAASQIANRTRTNGQKKQQAAQIKLLQDPANSVVEVLTEGVKITDDTADPSKGYISVLTLLQQPFSRGSTHINSVDPTVKPTIDPNYFDIDFDLKVLVGIAKWVRSTWIQTTPFQNIVASLNFPGSEVQTDDQWITFVKNNIQSQSHTTGTCSMLPKSDGGVVDPTLKVYGTSNVRVVDLSVMPQQFSGHPQALTYMIGEKGADLIKAANK